MASSDQIWYEDLLVELECPVCTDYMSPPIRQCATGHNICWKCRNKLSKCPICQGKFTESRNLSLEGLVSKIRYPCINKNLGCNAQLSYRERDLHELRCPLKGFSCAMDKCSWVGKLDELLTHWHSKKITSKPYTKSNICHTKIKAESYYVNIVSAYSNLFWFKCKLINNKLFWAVQFIGNSSDAEDYYYEIEIFKPGRPVRKIVIGDYCQPIDFENNQLFNGETCLSINTETIQNFVSDDQLLIYYMRVNQVKNRISDGAEGNPSNLTGKEVKSKNSSSGATGTKSRDRSKGPPHKGKKPFVQKRDEFVLL